MSNNCVDCKVDISDQAAQARRCKECKRKLISKRGSAYNKANPHIGRKASLKFYYENHAAMLQRNKRIARSKREKKLQNKYKITLTQWEGIFTDQGSCCAICKGTRPLAKNWNTDHNHITGNIRGILCAPCNWILGLAKDDQTILQTAIDYLRKDL